MAHEALIRGWQRLRGWVDQDREFLRTRERIAAQAKLWESEGRPPDRLLPPGRLLAEGDDLLATRRVDLDADLITYVEISVAAAKAVRRKRWLLVTLLQTAVTLMLVGRFSRMLSICSAERLIAMPKLLVALPSRRRRPKRLREQGH